MLYYLFNYLDQLDFPGAGMFKYVSFRSALALILSLFISTAIGRRIIDKLQMLQIGETVRNLGLEGQMSKKGTPTMGGIIIIIAIVVPTLLCAKLTNIYVILMLVTTIWLGALGFADDYIKVFRKNKEGMHGKFKIIGQIGLGLIVGLVLAFAIEFLRRPLRSPAQIEGLGLPVLGVVPLLGAKKKPSRFAFFRKKSPRFA